MRITRPVAFRASFSSQALSKGEHAPIISIKDGTFYRQQPSLTTTTISSSTPPTTQEASSKNPPLFPNLSFSLPSRLDSRQYWAIVGPSSHGKSTLLQILQGQHLCFPPLARSYPYLSSGEIAAKDPRLRSPGRAIRYVGFSDKNKVAGLGSYLSARYESRREATDYSLANYLRGHTALNPGEEVEAVDEELLEKVLNDLNLAKLADFPLMHLSNGQSRRARIAKALMAKPEVLLLDEPFMGLDPNTSQMLSPLLSQLAESSSPRLIMTLRTQETIPSWITHLMYLGEPLKVTHQGLVGEISKAISHRGSSQHSGVSVSSYNETSTKQIVEQQEKDEEENVEEAAEVDLDREKLDDIDGNASLLEARQRYIHRKIRTKVPPEGEPVIEMQGVRVQYGPRKVLGDWVQDVDGQEKEGLWWTVRRGQRWAVFGPNGSGKTTMLSLITSDHPQAYSVPVKLFGRSRLPEPGQPGISIFDIQSRIGHSSPEIHQLFPKSLTLRQTIESAFSDTPLGRPMMDYEDDVRVEHMLRWFRAELTGSSAPLISSLPIPTPSTHISAHQRSRQRTKGMSERKLNSALDQPLDWADELLFGEMTTSGQKVALFLRALVRKPDLVILDEPFSGMDDFVRDKCMVFLEEGEMMLLVGDPQDPLSRDVKRRHSSRAAGDDLDKLTHAAFQGLEDHQALLVISHIKEEVPRCVSKYILLPEQGTQQPPSIRNLPHTFRGVRAREVWKSIWNQTSGTIRTCSACKETKWLRYWPTYSGGTVCVKCYQNLRSTGMVPDVRRRQPHTRTRLVPWVDTCGKCGNVRRSSHWHVLDGKTMCFHCYMDAFRAAKKRYDNVKKAVRIERE